MRSTYRRIGLILVGVVIVALLWAGAVVITTAVRAPKRVSELQNAGALPFAPASLPASRRCALLAVQDPAFYRHRGIGLQEGSLGHTTVTQAVCKRLFFPGGFTPGLFRQRKIKLLLTAWAFDRRIPKETQLRLFLNLAYFGGSQGNEIRGFPAAAEIFFGKPVDNLSDQKYLALLAMLDAPNRYDVVRHADLNAARVREIAKLVERACASNCIGDNCQTLVSSR